MTSLWLAAKVLACASAACAVAAIAPERGSDAGETEVEGAAAEEPREKRSPRTREPKSLEDVLRAKEAAKERKRRVREEQELLAKQEEEERAEIARLVVLERARREAADARAAAEELERKKREAEEEAKRRLFPGGARGRLHGDGSFPGRNERRNGREERERRGGGVEGAVVRGFSPRFFPRPTKRLMPPFFPSPGADVDAILALRPALAAAMRRTSLN